MNNLKYLNEIHCNSRSRFHPVQMSRSSKFSCLDFRVIEHKLETSLFVPSPAQAPSLNNPFCPPFDQVSSFVASHVLYPSKWNSPIFCESQSIDAIALGSSASPLLFSPFRVKIANTDDDVVLRSRIINLAVAGCMLSGGISFFFPFSW